MKNCKERYTCGRFWSGDTKPPNQDVRHRYMCFYWNGEYCTDNIAGVKEGDACNLEKVRRIKKNA